MCLQSHKKILLCLALALMVSNLQSATNVGGLVSANTAWTRANSPYVVMSNILVLENVTLTVQAGVIVKISSGKLIQVNGTLIARGTETDSIRFTANDTSAVKGPWKSIYFTPMSRSATYNAANAYISGSCFQYAVIEYGAFSDSVTVPDTLGPDTSSLKGTAVKLDSAAPYVGYCAFRFNQGTSIGGVIEGKMVVRNSTFLSNQGGGIDVTGPLHVENSYFQYNLGNAVVHSTGVFSVVNTVVRDNTGSGLVRNPGDEPVSPVITVERCDISGNRGNGMNIYCHSSGNAFYIRNNKVRFNREAGIYAAWESAIKGYIEDNTVEYNTGAGILSRGPMFIRRNIAAFNGTGGIRAWHDNNAAIEISNNIVAENDGFGIYDSSYQGTTVARNAVLHNARFGIRSVNAAAVANNTLFENNASDAAGAYVMYTRTGAQAIHYNNILGRTGMHLLSNGNPSNTASLDAKNNWWGTTDDAKIQQGIRDWLDNPAVSLVLYSPFLPALDITAPILPPRNVTKQFANPGVLLSWTPNEEEDADGYRIFIYHGDSLYNSVPVPFDRNGLVYLNGSITDSFAVTALDRLADGASDMVEGHESWYAIPVLGPPVAGENPVKASPAGAWAILRPLAGSRHLLTYHLPSRGRVWLDLFNVDGKLAGRLIGGSTQSGTHSFTHDASSLPAGVYVYRLRMGGKHFVFKAVNVR